jgi:potassium channel subfamily K
MKVRADTDYSGKTAVSSTPLRKPEPPPRHSSEEAAEASGKEVASATFANTMPHVEGGADYTPPKYRWTPILSGLLQPFAILLEIPGLTEHWYVRLDRSTNTPVAYQENPTWLNAALGISVSCAVIANMSLISRFLERKVLASTVTCIVALSIHDIINITIVSIFGVIHGVDDGFDYSQAFWMCVCSTVASFFTNCTLIYDIIRTNDFRNSGSGLTIKQRNLVIVVMILLAYLALGALAFKFLIPDLNFESALYFTVVSLETIGFGDIAPSTVGSRIFLFFYLPIGIFLLAITVGTTRSTLLEWTAATYKRRRHRILEAYRKRRLKREEELARRQELEKRIADFGAPTYIQTSKKPKLNIDVLHAGHIMGAEMDAQAKLLKRSETLSPLSPLPVQEISDRVAQEGGDRRTEALRLQEELQKQSAENESLYRDMQEALAREEKVENWAKVDCRLIVLMIDGLGRVLVCHLLGRWRYSFCQDRGVGLVYWILLLLCHVHFSW